MSTLPEKTAVYGGGRMGAGIAHALLVSGSSVSIVEADATGAEAARERVAVSIGRAADRGLLTDEPGAVLDRLAVTTDPAVLGAAALVVEAVPEDVGLKAKVLSIIEQAAPEADLATNTSSLSVDGLASGLRRPERFIGLHFFNPVPASDLVEIVVGSATASDLVEQAQGWVASLGKTGITVTDSPGFASSRLGVFIALEAIRMVEDGVASAEDIDTAMTLGYKHPTGPLRTTDIVGLDVRLAIAEHLERELGPRFAPPQLLRDKVAAGTLGRKTGEGFFTW
ncbi:3-hydroxybutyryl-CoA dehydrogenase [Aeromicrobium sp. Root495]|uniref:3-hydroxyacyl-CoA dehydrogenase family protein n=1 Tax=Aeromicrobium sp. Root495 TaxID=1736550 RepID=UPI0006FCBCC0|nr:3-hydroxyacyl-CoA dehydrogenase family protein [Aeromicrobium sp. Root495]KQY55710.1 3-hydroxybutyryl-CoA dehydrogenase [Aeromicrobium sp. Root495]